MQLVAHKPMTCLGLSKSDWFGHPCKDQHDVWAGQTPWLTSNQYLLSICVAVVFRRGLRCSMAVSALGHHHQESQANMFKQDLWGLPPWKLLPSPTPRSPVQPVMCSRPSLRAGKTRPPSCISSSFYQAVVPDANSIPQGYWSMAHFKTLFCVYTSCPPPAAFLFWINFFQSNPE